MSLFSKIHFLNTNKWIGLLLIVFSILSNQTFSQSYKFRNFSVKDGLAQSFVYSIIQDVQGYLWVGTGNGLSRFNGFTFENYTAKDSLADNFISSGIVDGKCLWFGHLNGKLSCFNGKKFHTVTNPIFIQSPMTHFAKDLDGHVWVSSYSEGLLELNKQKGVVKRDTFKAQQFVTTFEFLNEKELLVGTISGLLYCSLKNPGQIEIFRSITEIPASKIICIKKRKNNHGFYIATENDGIFLLDQKGEQISVLKIKADPDVDFSGIQDLNEDSQSNLWLATFGNGLVKLHYTASGKFQEILFNATHGYALNNVKTVFEDSEGNIWSGNYGEGLSQIIRKTFFTFPLDNKKVGFNVFSFFFDQKYKWLGTDKGLVKIDQTSDKMVSFYGKGNGLPNDTITSIYSPDGKVLWIGTSKNGVYCMETTTEKFTKYPVDEGTLENSISKITGKGDQLWIGTKKGLLNVQRGDHVKKWYTIHQGLPHNAINGIYIDHNNKLWVSSNSNVLAYIQNEKVVRIPLSSNNSNFTLGPITEDSESRIWVGSNGNGVYMIGHDSIANLTVKEGLLSNYCYSIIADSQKNIWVGHKGGLSKIGTMDFSVKPIEQFEDITDHYQFNPNATSISLHGQIWFGSDHGVVSYEPSSLQAHLIAPVLGITSVKVNDEVKEFANTIILSPGTYKLRIDFFGLSLREPALVTYQYRLDGYEQWSDVTKNTSVVYPHLTEGEYTFVLKASSGDGVVTQTPLTFRIIVKKTVWKNWWFYVGMLISLTLLIFFYLKWRFKRLIAEKSLLEKKVLERTVEIQSQKSEIEKQRDVIEKRNTEITSSITYASYIQTAVFPTHELVNTLFPNNFIFNKPKDIVSGDFYWVAEKQDKIIFSVADCTGHGVPGAFMSLLGITFLNEIVNIQGITQADAIVSALRVSVNLLLQQNRKDSITNDGMDIALCVLDKNHHKLQYTGAMNDLIFVHEGKLEIIGADHIMVGGYNDSYQPFTLKEFFYTKGDMLYLFSDGFKDQFGGDHDKKYLSRRFKETLFEIHYLPLVTQKELLEKKLQEWKKQTIQTDDITVWGIRL